MRNETYRLSSNTTTIPYTLPGDLGRFHGIQTPKQRSFLEKEAWQMTKTQEVSQNEETSEKVLYV